MLETAYFSPVVESPRIPP